tara:strand:- start:430 stop:582 length:153 start_codon:yes stop_codon:yes gene_type:complete
MNRLDKLTTPLDKVIELTPTNHVDIQSKYKQKKDAYIHTYKLLLPFPNKD